MKRTLKSSELARLLESHGWQGKKGASSHIIYRHPQNPAVLSFPFINKSDDIRPGLLGKIQRLSKLRLRG